MTSQHFLFRKVVLSVFAKNSFCNKLIFAGYVRYLYPYPFLQTGLPLLRLSFFDFIEEKG